MAGNKKKKKPASNPARGFATTSIASKPKGEKIEDEFTLLKSRKPIDEQAESDAAPPGTNVSQAKETTRAQDLSPEEFEKQLDDFELQSIVEKYAKKSRRDAARQITRLQTDRRILRAQADSLSTRKWFPPELLEEFLETITQEFRSTALETTSVPAPGSEEELVARLWTLQQVLQGTGFSEESVKSVLQYILNILDKVANPNKESIWGIDEAMDWLARESSKEDLPDYDNWFRKVNQGLRSQLDTPTQTPPASGRSTPQLQSDTRHLATSTPIDKKALGAAKMQVSQSKSKVSLDYDSDIDPDDLLPQYLEIKTKLFQAERSKPKSRNPKDSRSTITDSDSSRQEVVKLQRKLKRIENDILFDKLLAEQQWENQRILLEKQAASERASTPREQPKPNAPASQDDESEDEVSREAARIAAELLAENGSDDDDLGGLFENLPTTEVDPLTGKSSVVLNEANGTKTIIRDFGKLTGMTPRRILEEACRARDSSSKISHNAVSTTNFSSRHSVTIAWSKSQEEPPQLPSALPFEYQTTSRTVTVSMSSVSTPDIAQSEAYAATAALFVIFNSSVREEKLYLRLPPAYRELWTEFVATKKDAEDAADRETVRKFRDSIRLKRDREEEDGIVLKTSFRNRAPVQAVNGNKDGEILRNDQSSLDSEVLRRIWTDKSSSPSFRKMLNSRMQLPMWSFRNEILNAIDREQVIIICGETGCGKSTQVPSFILEHQLLQGKPCKVYCTEPRRISAISLARRVSEELGERKNDLGSPRSLVGYAIRLESNTSKETRLVYATTGIVMRMLEGSNDLKDITHIVLDEVHERSIDSDFLLIVLKKLITRRPDLKVVLMSATVDAERFSKYLDGAPVLYVPGRTFPVEVKYLEDAIELTGYDLDNGCKNNTNFDDDFDDDAIENTSRGDVLKTLRNYSARTRNTIAQIDEYRIEYDLVTRLISKIATDDQFTEFSKAILVFLPGIAEIRQLNDMLSGHSTFSSDWDIYPLHSTIASEDQEAAFLIPPAGRRKIVLATNIAETGITIPDVTCVIDTGKHREMRFDERRQLSRLLETFISRANAKQRRGRAGRVQKGLCFHLFTKHRHDEMMPDQQTPELLRLSLQDLAIRVKICKLGGIEEVLGQALDPPSTKNIRRAIDALVDVRALTPAEDLTFLGQQLARLPLDVFLGKLIIIGSIFKCLDATVTIAAILSSKSPFTAPFGARAQADTVRLAFRKGDSDVLTAYNAYLAWKRVCNSAGESEAQFCRKNFLSMQTLSNIEDLKGQLIVSLIDSGFLVLTEAERAALNTARFQTRRRQFFDLPQRTNINSDNDLVTTSVIAWSFYPKLLTRDGKGWRNVANNQSISLHPSSVNRGHHEISWMSYYHIMQAKQFYNAHETTAVDEFAIALLCGDVRFDMFSGVIILDGNRARFSVSDWKTMLIIKILRLRLREILTRSFKNPDKPITAQQQRWMALWQKLFTQEPEDR